MSLISGQKPVVTRFKKSISNFKTRIGANAGVKVTLRSHRMYEFVDRLVNIALPRIKDFRGLSTKGFDRFGNYSFGIKEHIIFPEINFDKVDRIRGMDITIVTSGKKKASVLALLESLNFPFINFIDLEIVLFLITPINETFVKVALDIFFIRFLLFLLAVNKIW